VKGILYGKLKMLRKPGAFIATTIICIAFAFLMGTSSYSNSKIIVPVYSTMEDDDFNQIVKELNDNDTYQFEAVPKRKALDEVSVGKANAGLELEQDSYVLYTLGGANSNDRLIEQYVDQFYQEKLKEEVVNEATGSTEVFQQINQNPLLDIHITSFQDDEEWVYDQTLQSLFGYVLFFSIYTVAFNVVEILRDKQSGIWDRLILSPTSKTQIYVGNLLYSFFIGYFQIALIFCVFKFMVGVDFKGAFGAVLLVVIPYLFAIVAMSILLTGLVKTMGQYNAVIPLVGVSFAMLGGAYWPIEIVSSELLLGLSKFIPITYGMELLKGVTVSGLSVSDLLYPIGLLLLMGVVMMGIGIRLVERRHV
jgi:ABC-2 type transport system permease protein